MGSINLSRLRRNAKAIAKSAAEAALIASAGAALAVLIWPEQARGVLAGTFAAWLVSSVSAGALLAAKAVSPRAFWWAFGGGVTLRLAALAVLMVLSASRFRLPQAGLLLSYCFGVLGCLLVEYRHIKIK